MTRLIVYNPLPIAYTHREKQLSKTLGDGLEFVRTENEGLGRTARILALLRHIRIASRLRRSKVPVLITWPLLGWLEIILWSSSNSCVFLSIHDPRPLRPQIGLGKASAWLARRVPARWRPGVIAHSSVARDVIFETLPGSTVTLLPLPMLPQASAGLGGARSRQVLVLGQYKPARDLEILSQLSHRLREAGITGRVAGRGWPPIEGWEVHNCFLSEAEFDAELARSACLLIPYRHYFQSGVAARAVELGTPVVGSEHPFLCESLGLDKAPGIVRDASLPEAWMNAISASIDAGSTPVDVFSEVQRKWTDWLAQT